MKMYSRKQVDLHDSWRSNIAAACHIVSEFTEVPSPDKSCFILNDDLRLGAGIRAQEILQPEISFNKGTFYTLHDLALKASLDMAIFNDYSVEKISGLSQLWALMHELGHWMLGHCALITDGVLDEGELHLFTLSAPKKSARHLTLDERICLELQADGIALELMIYDSIYIRSEYSPWNDNNRGKEDTNISIDDILPRMRALLTASCTTVLIFEKDRLLTNSQSTKYPLPLTRLTNLVATAFRVITSSFGLLEMSNKGHLILSKGIDWSENSLLHKIFSAITAVFYDLKPIIECLSVDLASEDAKTFCAILDFDSDIPFFQNLQRYMIGAEILHDVDGDHKKSIEEYIRLHRTQASVNNLLRDNYALIEV